MRANPKANWAIADVEAVCREHGVECGPARGGGSHYKVKHPAIERILTVPFKRPIKPVYIRQLVEMIDLTKART
jgi:predicted RNA binding protein YcfA (HicA-like mRNA interferase family)